MVESLNISKPKYVILSPETYTKYYNIMLATNLVARFYVYGNTCVDAKITSFEELTRTHVDLINFRPYMDWNGKSNLDCGLCNI